MESERETSADNGKFLWGRFSMERDLVRHGVCVGAEQGGRRGEVEVCGEVVGGQIA